MVLTEDQACEFIKEILAERRTNGHPTILGAQLKTILIERAKAIGAEFDEKALGYTSFSRFVQDSGVAIVKYRGSNDVLIASKDHVDDLNKRDQRQERIRRSFWDAFVRFPVEGEYRGYRPDYDEIVIGSSPNVISNAVTIHPIQKELQLEWRRQFVEDLGPDSPLADYQKEFTPRMGFALFSQILSKHPQFRPTWNKFFSGKVNDFIAEWARRYGVPDGIWIESELEQDEDNARAKLYAILDQVSIEELVELRIPLKWLLNSKKIQS